VSFLAAGCGGSPPGGREVPPLGPAANRETPSSESGYHQPTISLSGRFPFSMMYPWARALVLRETERGYEVLHGEETLFARDVAGFICGDRRLMITAIAPPKARVVVKVHTGPLYSDPAVLARIDAAGALDAPVLVEESGVTDEPIGYIYQDRAIVRIRYEPDAPLGRWEQVPIGRFNRADCELTLLFAVRGGAPITEFRIGDRVIAPFDPPVVSPAAE
jgi:hypothetical protein